MLMIRLQRVGRKNDPSFRVVVTDSRNSTKSGKFIEIAGSYDARKGKPSLKEERIKYWLSVGAKPSATAHNILVSKGVINAPKIDPVRKKATNGLSNGASVSAEDKNTLVETPAVNV